MMRATVLSLVLLLTLMPVSKTAGVAPSDDEENPVTLWPASEFIAQHPSVPFGFSTGGPLGWGFHEPGPSSGVEIGTGQYPEDGSPPAFPHAGRRERIWDGGDGVKQWLVVSHQMPVLNASPSSFALQAFQERTNVGGYVEIGNVGGGVPHPIRADSSAAGAALQTGVQTRTFQQVRKSSASENASPLQTGVRTHTFQQGLNGYSGACDTWVSSLAWDTPPQHTVNYGQNAELMLSRNDGDNPLLRFDLTTIPTNTPPPSGCTTPPPPPSPAACSSTAC